MSIFIVHAIVILFCEVCFFEATLLASFAAKPRTPCGRSADRTALSPPPRALQNEVQGTPPSKPRHIPLRNNLFTRARTAVFIKSPFGPC